MTPVSDWMGHNNALRIDCFKSASVGDVMYLDSVILAKSAKVVYDTEYIYFYADNSSDTGCYGYDYIVNYKAQGSDKTSVAKNTVNSSYSFEITNNSIEYKTSGNMIMIKVPFSELGITDYSNITFYFKWGDSTSNLDTMEKCTSTVTES